MSQTMKTANFTPLPVHLENCLPCPFCGSLRIVKGERYYAMCVDCGATGPERNADATVKKFTGDWNTRQHDKDAFRAGEISGMERAAKLVNANPAFITSSQASILAELDKLKK